MLDVYVFDYEETKTTDYIGLARIPLLTLSLGKSVKGTFHLLKVNLSGDMPVALLISLTNMYPAMLHTMLENQLSWYPRDVLIVTLDDWFLSAKDAQSLRQDSIWATLLYDPFHLMPAC